jgi:hypothetical protein
MRHGVVVAISALIGFRFVGGNDFEASFANMLSPVSDHESSFNAALSQRPTF